MMRARAHPLALVTVASAYWVVAAVWDVQGRDRVAAVVLSAILEGPLAIILWAHLRRSRSWLHDAWLAMCAGLIAYACVFALFLVVWFHLGWPGSCLFGGVLSIVAAACALLVRREKTMPNAA